MAAWGAEWLSRGRIDLRFRRPTYDGDELLVDLADGRLTVSDCSGEVRRVGSAGRSADRPDLTGYRQPAEPVEEEEPAAEADFVDTRGHLGFWEGPSATGAGRHGKPFYMAGPNDHAARVLRQLELSARVSN